MSTASEEIVLQRKRAAEFSAGTSADVIYSKIVEVMAAHGLQGRVLDYGAGVGDFTRRLVEGKRFVAVSAADIMRAPENIGAAVEWIEQDLNEAMAGHEGAFDVVVAAEVIEHLENPRFMVREIYRLLRAGGTAVISTPNNESWRAMMALLLRGHFVAFGETSYPAHITALLRKDLTRIFLEANFLAPAFYFTDVGGFPGKPTVTWQRISFGTLRGLRFSDNVVAVAKKPD